ncbi:MAG TPA: hypothetical protein VF399_12050 [bacterium]
MNVNKLLNILIIIICLVSMLEGLALIKGVDGAALSAMIGLFCAIAGIIGTVLRYKIKHHHDQK